MKSLKGYSFLNNIFTLLYLPIYLRKWVNIIDPSMQPSLILRNGDYIYAKRF